MPLAVSPYARIARAKRFRQLPPGRMQGPGAFRQDRGFWWKRKRGHQHVHGVSKANERRLAILRVPAAERGLVY